MAESILIVSQVYVPDPAAAGQHLHDAARQLVARGHRVVVVASAWGHQDNTARYPSRETRDGVEIRRLPAGNLGKSSIWARLAGNLSFLAQALVAGGLQRSTSVLLVSTSPPLAPPFANLLSRLLSAPLLLWMMDINPDQAIIAEGYSPASRRVRLLDAGVKAALKRATRIVTLDRFMLQRLERKVAVGSKATVIPPWPLQELEPAAAVARESNSFRVAHGFGAKRVIMYSGNISATHPLTTLLEALKQCPERDEFLLVLVGDGTGRPAIEQFAQENPEVPIRFLPYQPLSALQTSLSAADIHLISMGDEQVGVVHPCKVYGVMAIARPFIYLGPASSHVGDIVSQAVVGWHVCHGDVPAGVSLLSRLAKQPLSELAAAGQKAHELLVRCYGREQCLAQFCDEVEAVAARGRAGRTGRS